MSQAIKLNSLALVFTVADLDRTRKFYHEVIGLTLEQHDGYLLGKLPGSELVFFQGEATRGTSPVVVFGLEGGGIDTLAERLAEQGVQLLTPVSEAPGGWSLELADPDSHTLAFFQDGGLPRALTG